MDNNNPQPAPVPSQPAPAVPNIPQPIQAEMPGGQAASSGSKMALWFVIGLVVVLAIVGGVYFMFSRQQVQKPAGEERTAVQTPIPAPKEDLEGELNAIDMQAPDSDFTSIDKDLQNL